MGHLPSPGALGGPTNVPFYGGERFDGADFLGYPERCGRSPGDFYQNPNGVLLRTRLAHVLKLLKDLESREGGEALVDHQNVLMVLADFFETTMTFTFGYEHFKDELDRALQEKLMTTTHQSDRERLYYEYERCCEKLDDDRDEYAANKTCQEFLDEMRSATGQLPVVDSALHKDTFDKFQKLLEDLASRAKAQRHTTRARQGSEAKQGGALGAVGPGQGAMPPHANAMASTTAFSSVTASPAASDDGMDDVAMEDDANTNMTGPSLQGGDLDMFNTFIGQAQIALEILSPEIPEGAHTLSNTVAFLQQWLFFGMLVEAFHIVGLEIDADAYISKGVSPVLTMANFQVDLTRWRDREAECAQAQRLDHRTNLGTHLGNVLRLSESMDVSDPRVSDLLRAVRTVCLAFQQYSPQVYETGINLG